MLLALQKVTNHAAWLAAVREGMGYNLHRTRRSATRRRIKEERRQNAPLLDNTPADLRIVILGVVAFLAALFLVTKLALGL